jgi:hypothetical protein
MKRAREEESPNGSAAAAPMGVSWGLGTDVRLALFVATDAGGDNTLAWPCTVYYLPAAHGLLGGVTFTLYALLDVRMDCDTLSSELQNRYLHAHTKHDERELAAMRSNAPHAYRLALLLKWKRQSEYPAVQTLVRVSDYTKTDVGFHYKPFADPAPGPDGKPVPARPTRIVEITVDSHHLLAHLMSAHARWDELIFHRNEEQEYRRAFALLVKDRTSASGRTQLARQSHAFTQLRAQLPLSVEAFEALCQMEKQQEERSRAEKQLDGTESYHAIGPATPSAEPSPEAPVPKAKKRYDLSGRVIQDVPKAAPADEGKAKSLVQKPIAFKVRSTLTIQCAEAVVHMAYGVLVSGAFTVFGERKLETPLDIAHFMGAKGRWLEEMVFSAARTPFFKVSLAEANLVRALSGGGALGADGRPRVKSTEELIAAYVPPPPRPPKAAKRRRLTQAAEAAAQAKSHEEAMRVCSASLGAPLLDMTLLDGVLPQQSAI